MDNILIEKVLSALFQKDELVFIEINDSFPAHPPKLPGERASIHTEIPGQLTLV